MAYQDFFPHLWDAVSYNGQRWGVPQDIEVRMVFYRKDHLAALGWSDEEIADLPRRIRDKEFMLERSGGAGPADAGRRPGRMARHSPADGGP